MRTSFSVSQVQPLQQCAVVCKPSQLLDKKKKRVQTEVSVQHCVLLKCRCRSECQCLLYEGHFSGQFTQKCKYCIKQSLKKTCINLPKLSEKEGYNTLSVYIFILPLILFCTFGIFRSNLGLICKFLFNHHLYKQIHKPFKLHHNRNLHVFGSDCCHLLKKNNMTSCQVQNMWMIWSQWIYILSN